MSEGRRSPPTRRYARGFAARTVEPPRLSNLSLPPLDPDSGRWPGREVDVDGQRLFVRSTPPLQPADGSRIEPALFVHGLGGASTNWTDLSGQLRGRLAVEALDLPGFGRSGPSPSRDYRPEALAGAVIRYLERSPRGPVHLAGNSMGGTVAILVASRRPDLVRTLVLISPAVPDIRLRLYPVRYNPRMALMAVPGLAVPAVRRGAARITPEQIVRGTIALCFADPTRYPPQRLAESIAEARERAGRPWAAEALVRAGRGLARLGLRAAPQFWTQLNKIEAPTLVLWGDTDRLVSPDLAPAVAAAIPDSRLLALEHIGHVAMMEDPVTTARAMLGFLDDAGRAATPTPAPATAPVEGPAA
jgi:pimeloyl-ACP methyl ester carboxylesterase